MKGNKIIAFKLLAISSVFGVSLGLTSQTQMAKADQWDCTKHHGMSFGGQSGTRGAEQCFDLCIWKSCTGSTSCGSGCCPDDPYKDSCASGQLCPCGG